MTDKLNSDERSGWPHAVAVTLACATFPLIWVGGLVTTYDAGMAVEDWPTTYGYNMFLYPWQTWVSGPWDVFVEHGHRLLGALVGVITIVLNLLVWRFDRRQWVRWLAVAALVLVVAQGTLGGMRVRMDSTALARIHGCTGPLFFALTLLLCVTTSKFWFRKYEDGGTTRGAVVSAWVFFLLAYVQLVIGSHLRHPEVYWAPNVFRMVVVFHVVLAFALLVKTASLTRKAWRLPATLSRPAMSLTLLVATQVALGIAAWRAKYGWPSFIPMFPESSLDGQTEIAVHRTLAGATVTAESMSQAITVTAHVAVGSLILGAAVTYATRLSRCYWEEHTNTIRGTVPANNTACRAIPATAVGGSSA